MVFGRVVSGGDVVRQIENLPVDANSRPLQDAKILKCGELVRQVKGNVHVLLQVLLCKALNCSQKEEEGRH